MKPSNESHPWRRVRNLAVARRKWLLKQTHMHCRDCGGEQPAFYQGGCGYCGGVNIDQREGARPDEFIDEVRDLEAADGVLDVRKPLERKKRALSTEEVKERLLWERGVA